MLQLRVGDRRIKSQRRTAQVTEAATEAADLWQQIRDRSEHALRVGALEVIETDSEAVEDSGVTFQVRVAHDLRRKRRAAARPTAGRNPFLPYDQELFVTRLGSSHVCLLNKFPVFDAHALIVTREFEPQESLLTRSDLGALRDCLTRADGLCFYNAGAVAGASQPHKHLQLVPVPLGAAGRVPIEALLPLGDLASRPAEARECPDLPFRHALIRVDDCIAGSPRGGVGELHARYTELLAATGCDAPTLPAYNLLVTRAWALLVPRRCESSLGIEVNSLGLAGALFAIDAEQLQALKARGPMQLLRDVTFPRS